MSDVSSNRGPNPKGRDELNDKWDSDAALTADGHWCRYCHHHRVTAMYGYDALCPSCRADNKPLPPPALEEKRTP